MKRKFSPLLLFILAFSLPVFTHAKQFPKFEAYSSEGKLFKNQNLKGKTSIVVLLHLGCPPAMYLLNDLNKIYGTLDTSKYQILMFSENTTEQVDTYFNATDTSLILVKVRNIFKNAPQKYPLFPVCEKDKTKIKNGTTSLKSNCRHLSYKFRSFSSPTIFIVNPAGELELKQKGYIQNPDENVRINWIWSLVPEEFRT